MKKIKRIIRKFLFKFSYLLGNKFSEFMIRTGYSIQSSLWFKNCRVPFFKHRKEMYNYIVPKYDLSTNEITYLEFGVSKGWGFHFWYQTNKNQSSQFYGFDTFEGIPDDWGNVKKGAYTANGVVPKVDDSRCKFIVGLFQDTIDNFIEINRLDKQLVILLDADLYNATLFVLIKLRLYLKKGDIIIFDEFFSVSKADHEMRAFIDFLLLFKFEYEEIAKTPNQLAIIVK